MTWHDVTDFDVLTMTDERVSFDIKIAPSTYAGRVFRDAAFFPSWHANLLLLQTVPFIQMTGGEARREYQNSMGFLPGYLLAYLDCNRDIALEARLGIYEHCAQLMSAYPELCEQLLLRLQEDAWRFSSASVIDLLNIMSETGPSETYISLVNDLWWRVEDGIERNAMVNMLRDFYATSPQIEHMAIDRHLLSAIKKDPVQDDQGQIDLPRRMRRSSYRHDHQDGNPDDCENSSITDT
jgi:hypothetical protein